MPSAYGVKQDDSCRLIPLPGSFRKCTRRQILRINLYTEFLRELSYQRICGNFLLLDLAAGKLPKAPMLLL